MSSVGIAVVLYGGKGLHVPVLPLLPSKDKRLRPRNCTGLYHLYRATDPTRGRASERPSERPKDRAIERSAINRDREIERSGDRVPDGPTIDRSIDRATVGAF